jgi:dienelactone hydrolase
MSSPYSSESYLLQRFELISRQAGLRARSVEELQAWQAETRARLGQMIGLPTMRYTDFALESQEPVQCDGYTRQWFSIATEPGIRMPFYLLKPDGASGPLPTIIATHGHGGGGKESVAGRRDLPFMAEVIDQYHYNYGEVLVRQGYLVVCPDARGFGERRERAVQGDEREQVLASSCRVLNNMAIPLGQTVIGMWTWDLMLLIDYLTTREDCDPERLCALGLSGGGAQALWLAALDERVRVAVVSGYFYGYRDSLLILNENCSCNYVPNLWQTVDMGDLGALIAPRPLHIESGDKDPLNGPRGLINVDEQLEIARQAYALSGDQEKLAHSVFSGVHRWDGTEVYPWLKQVL